MRSKIILLVTILVVIVCSTIIYRLLFETPSTLYYINIVVVCFAEVVLLVNVPVLSNKKLLTIKNASLSISLNLFAIILFLWTTGCSLFMNEDSNLRNLYIGLLIITVIFIVSGTTIIMAGQVTEKQAEGIQNTIKNRKDFLISMDSYWFEIKNGLEDVNSAWKDRTLYSLKVVLDKISIIPASAFNEHLAVTKELTTRIKEILKLCQEIKATPDNCELQSCLTLETEKLRNYIRTIKSSL